MSVEKGLNSTEVEVIKDARATAKGKVTKNIKSLKKALVRADMRIVPRGSSGTSL